MEKAKTLFEKLWNSHHIKDNVDGSSIIYIDRHMMHEVTSPQAFEGLANANRIARRPKQTLATADHNIPTKGSRTDIADSESKLQIATLETNVEKFNIPYFGVNDIAQGIVHVVGPEQGFTLPGMTIVCGDSHTATHGAFGSLAFGIGTSEVEHVLATQTLVQKKPKSMLININGELPFGSFAKDIILAVIKKIGTAGGTGYAIEFAGSTVRSLSMEGRMTICNMAIEAGARAGMIAPDEVTFAYLKDRNMAPKGELWDKAIAYWQSLPSDEGATYDKVVEIDAAEIIPQVTWGTSPEDVISIDGHVPDIAPSFSEAKAESYKRKYEYMGLKPQQKAVDINIDYVFIGSCTNGRIEDLRIAAQVAKFGKVADNVTAIVVPGSGLVKKQAEEEGLDKVFMEAGFEWRDAGCSMCLAMNADRLKPAQSCASTSNRNFEGRQGRGGRTHLMSPAMAAYAAIKGNIADVREIMKG